MSEIRLLFLGDIVGKPGRELVRKGLPSLIEHYAVDLVIANAENAAAGRGITREIGDQYMFGPAFLVSPVTTYKARSRPVYLPGGTAWYDFWTGQHAAGGQTIAADAPYDRLPLYVPAGSIVPTFAGSDVPGP